MHADAIEFRSLEFCKSESEMVDRGTDTTVAQPELALRARDNISIRWQICDDRADACMMSNQRSQLCKLNRGGSRGFLKQCLFISAKSFKVNVKIGACCFVQYLLVAGALEMFCEWFLDLCSRAPGHVHLSHF